MTIYPRDVLSAFNPKLTKRLPPPRFTEDDSLLIKIRDLIAEAENIQALRNPLRTLLGESIVQLNEQEAARCGLIGILYPEIA